MGSILPTLPASVPSQGPLPLVGGLHPDWVPLGALTLGGAHWKLVEDPMGVVHVSVIEKKYPETGQTPERLAEFSRMAPDRLAEKVVYTARNKEVPRKRTATPRARWDKGHLTAMLKKALSADDGYWARRLVNGLIYKACKGNPAAQKLVWDRADGVLTEKLNLSGQVELQKHVTLVDMRDKPELPPLDVIPESVNGNPGPA